MRHAFWAKLGAPMSSKKVSGLKLMLSTSVVSAMTFLSRILGLVRDVVFARYFGASFVMDAFLVAILHFYHLLLTAQHDGGAT